MFSDPQPKERSLLFRHQTGSGSELLLVLLVDLQRLPYYKPRSAVWRLSYIRSP